MTGEHCNKLIKFCLFNNFAGGISDRKLLRHSSFCNFSQTLRCYSVGCSKKSSHNCSHGLVWFGGIIFYSKPREGRLVYCVFCKRIIISPQVVYSPRPDRAVRFCQQVSTAEFENQRHSNTQMSALEELLEGIIKDENMTVKEKRRKLKQVACNCFKICHIAGAI